MSYLRLFHKKFKTRADNNINPTTQGGSVQISGDRYTSKWLSISICVPLRCEF